MRNRHHNLALPRAVELDENHPLPGAQHWLAIFYGEADGRAEM
jgi:hypothetical protein